MGLITENFTIKHYFIRNNNRFPNNEKLPVILYQKILNLPAIMKARLIRTLFKKNGWYNSWKGGVFTYHHYHSTTHEVLGFYKGRTTLLLGGDNGTEISVEKGDVLIIPAGVAHKNINDENSVTCLAAYPDGKDYDMNYGHTGERPITDQNIESVILPKKDPVLGLNGALQKYW
jgi:uncharacterized protein YjlB